MVSFFLNHGFLLIPFFSTYFQSPPDACLCQTESWILHTFSPGFATEFPTFFLSYCRCILPRAFLSSASRHFRPPLRAGGSGPVGLFCRNEDHVLPSIFFLPFFQRRLDLPFTFRLFFVSVHLPGVSAVTREADAPPPLFWGRSPQRSRRMPP